MLVRFSQCLLWLLATTIYPNLVANTQSLTNPVFWQVPIVYNTSNPLDQGNMINSESRLIVSQDFQVVNLGDDANYEHKRILIDMSSGCSQSTNLSTLQQWNDYLLTTSAIRSLPKIALIKRGECSWNKKVTAVSYLSFLYRLNIDAMMIYDNDTHGTNISFDIQSIAPDNSQKPATYNTPLPIERNITSMKDNDVSWNRNDSNSNNNNNNNNNNSSSSSNTTLYLPVYFTTNNYGLYLKRLAHFNSSSIAGGKRSSSELRQLYQIVPFLSTSPYDDNNENGDDNTGLSTMLSSSRGYLTYILVLVAVFIIGAILLRWWKVRKIQQRISTQNERVVHPDHVLHTRVNQVDPLPVSIVNSLPVIYYNVSNVKNAICCICLDDYIENKSQVRLLPCRHGFCVLCIDPWLTQKSSLCPICKYDCLPSDQRLERQQCQQQQPEHNTTTPDNHDMDISDAAITTSSTYSSNIINSDQSTSDATPQSHNQHHGGLTNPLQSLSLPRLTRHNDRSQSTAEQN